MANRTASIDYRVTGADQATGKVTGLAEALERQEARARSLPPALQRAAAATGSLGLVNKTAADELLRFGSALGPVGVGLAQLAIEGPRAIAHIVGVGAASERAAFLHRLLNTTLLVGTGVLLTGGHAATAYVRHLIDQGDAYQSLTAKIRIYTAGSVQAAQVQERLFASSRDARQGVEDQTRLFSRLAPALTDAGKGPEDAVRVANLVGKALTIQGATGQEATYGAIDLIHALGTGQLQGRQLRGLETEFPVLLRYIAANLQGPGGKTGVAYGALAEMAKTGQLSSEKILAALIKAEPQINKDFINAPKTAQQAWAQLENQILRLVGQTAIATGAQGGLYAWIQGLADKADAFRHKLLFDPASLKPLEDGARLIGDGVGQIANMGALALSHFDEIVKVGELIIALKLGEVMASWFSRTALAARSAIGSSTEFIAAARLAAGGAGAPDRVLAVRQFQAQATALETQAALKQAEASVRAERAALSRAAADEAVARAATLAAAADTDAAAKAVSYAEAEAVATRAAREKTAATSAQAAAEKITAAATAARTVATEAEIAVMAEATIGTTALAAAGRVLGGVYALLGGWIGIATIAIGGLIFAWEQDREKQQQLEEQLRRSIVVSDRMRAITDELTSATWNQIPALQAQAKAIRDVATANLDKVAGLRKADLAHLARIDAALKNPATADDVRGRLQADRANVQRALDNDNAVLGLGAADKAVQALEQQHQDAVVFSRSIQHLNDLLSRGKNERGDPLSAADVKGLEAQRAQAKAYAQQEFDVFAARRRAAKTADEQRSLGATQDVYAESITEATPIAGAHFDLNKPPKGRGSIDSAVKRAFDELLQEGAFNQNLQDQIGGTDRYKVRGDKVVDATSGANFTGGKDTAAAAQKFIDTIRLLDKATPGELSKFGGGKSRQELTDAAEEMFRYAVATSRAAKAQEGLASLKERLGIDTEKEGAATHAVNEFLRRYADQSFKDVEGLKARAEALDRVAEAQKALAATRPVFDEQYRIADETTLGAKGSTKAAELERQRQVTALARQLTVGALTARTDLLNAEDPGGTLEHEKDLQDQIAAIDLAAHEKTEQEIAKIDQDALKQRLANAQQYARQVEGAFHDLVFGGSFKDFGKRLANDLLEAVYEELIGNPLRKIIQFEIQQMLTPQGGGQGGLSGIFGSILRGLGGSTGAAVGTDAASATDATVTAAQLAGAFASGGRVTGPGGPQDDRILAAVSNGEFIVNARAASRHARLLDWLNRGGEGLPHYAAGGFVGGSPADVGRSLTGAGHPAPALTFAPTIHAPGADAAGMERVRQQMDEQWRQFQTFARGEDNRWLQRYTFVRKHPIG